MLKLRCFWEIKMNTADYIKRLETLVNSIANTKFEIEVNFNDNFSLEEFEKSLDKTDLKYFKKDCIVVDKPHVRRSESFKERMKVLLEEDYKLLRKILTYTPQREVYIFLEQREHYDKFKLQGNTPIYLTDFYGYLVTKEVKSMAKEVFKEKKL